MEAGQRSCRDHRRERDICWFVVGAGVDAGAGAGFEVGSGFRLTPAKMSRGGRAGIWSMLWSAAPSLGLCGAVGVFGLGVVVVYQVRARPSAL